MAISGYSIGGYWCLLMVTILVGISGYWCLLMRTILVSIGAY
jgi:hypothetical protein